MALNPVDIEVLEEAFKMSKSINQQLNSREVYAKLHGVSEDDFYDSLEIIERNGYIERSRQIAPRPPSFSLTSRGVLKQLEEIGNLRVIQIEVEEAIARKPKSTQSEIAIQVNHPPIFVAAVIDMLERNGDIRVRRGVDGSVEIAEVHATLRRRVKDADY
jgi:hypothetical protein